MATSLVVPNHRKQKTESKKRALAPTVSLSITPMDCCAWRMLRLQSSFSFFIFVTHGVLALESGMVVSVTKMRLGMISPG